MWKELWATARLAVPLGLAQLLMMAMGVVDVAFLGRFSVDELAGVAIGNAIAHSVQGFGMGIAFALEPLASQAVGAREEEGAWHWWRVIARSNLVVSLPMMALVMLAAYGLPLFGVAQGLTDKVVSYSWGRLASVPAFLYFLSARSYLQGHHRVRPVLLIVVAANLLNVVGNALLIFGDRALEGVGLPGIGLPVLGGFGAGISTSLSTILMALGLFAALRPFARQNPIRRPVTQSEVLKALRIGLSIGVQIVAEIGIFALVAVLAGRL
ncbi:MAG: MATE family efflux transporter, partial [Myxococcales bacterium]|nr:MATE family efflux transporter [Myxococcales bacterium]